MKKLINGADTVLEESLDGFAAAHADILLLGAERKFVRRRTLKPGKVALISGGGSGHEPLHAGFVGRGMLDAACPGQVFTSPTPDQMVEAAEAVDTGAGVLFIVKNYEGDVMNFTMAAEMAGREVASVVTNDDVAVEKSTYTTGRRGVAGTLIVEKMVGAAAENGMPLGCPQGARRRRQPAHALDGRGAVAVHRAGGGTAEFHAGRRRNGNGCRHSWRAWPAQGTRWLPPMRLPRNSLARSSRILRRSPGSEVLLLVNGFGATPLIELYLMVNSAKRILDGAGIKATRFLTGSYVTSLDMAGASITVSVLDGPGEGIVGCAGAHGSAALGRLITSRGLVFRYRRRPVGSILPWPVSARGPLLIAIFERDRSNKGIRAADLRQRGER